MIQSLINKRDNSEIVRDKIAAILLEECASQQALARAQGLEPADWQLQIYTERSDAWQDFQPRERQRCEDPVIPPIVNVSFESSSSDRAGSDPIEMTKVVGTYHIDVYGYGESGDADGGGHQRGDTNAAIEAQRGARLVRNILMAAEYVDLKMTGLVWDRWVDGMQVLEPSLDARLPAEKVIAVRVTLQVTFSEFSPQYEGQTFEGATCTVKRASDGRVYLVASFTPPPPS